MLAKYKNFIKEVTNVNENGVIEFAFSAFNEVDSYGDRTMPGFWKKSWNENKNRIFWLFNHSSNTRPGLIKEMYEDDKYVYAKVKANLNSLDGREVWEQEKFFFKESQPLEHSFGYYEIQDKLKKNDFGGVDLYEVKLLEISTLIIKAANPNTPTLDVKSFNTLESKMIELEKKYHELLQSLQTKQPEKPTELIKKTIDYNKLYELINNK